MIILDANAAIAFMDATDAHHESAVEILAARQDEEMLMHEVSMAEALVQPALNGDAVLDAAWARLLAMRIDQVGIVATPAEIAKLRASTRLPIPDCLVILSAAPPDDDTTILTFDGRLAAKARELGYRVEP